MVCRAQKLRNGVRTMFVLGRLQWNERCMDDTVRFFVGNSYKARRHATDFPAGNDANVVEFDSARCDASSIKRCAFPRLSKVGVGDFSQARDLDSVFSVV